jgi:hypothetical protein
MSQRVTGIVCSLVMLLALAGCKQKAAPPAKAPAPATPAPAPAPPSLIPQTAAQLPQSGPRWVCDQPVIDYGEVWVDTVVQRQFTYRNVGNQVLTLGKPIARCSCSAAPDYIREVPPGGTGTATFTLRTERKPYGPCVEYISFPTNDPATPKGQITLKGFIRTALDPEVTYDSIYERDKAAGKAEESPAKKGGLFGRVKSEDRLHRVIKLHNTSGRPLTLTMQPAQPGTRFQFELKETNPGQEYELTIKAEPPIPVGQWYTMVTLQTNIPEQPVYQVHVAAQVPPRVEIVPPGKMLIDQEAYPQKERQIKVINNGLTPVEVLAVSTSEPRYEIKLLPRDPAKPQEQVINIWFPGGTSYRPPVYGEIIEVKTSDPEVPGARIEVVPSMATPQPRPPDKPLQMYPVALPGAGGAKG